MKCPYCNAEMEEQGDKILILDDMLYYRGNKLQLTPVQGRLLSCLARGNGRPIPEGIILDNVYGLEADTPLEVDNTIKSHISYLRTKLRRFDTSLEIFTKHSYGYGLRIHDQQETKHAAHA